ncbi:MAG: hypothetical protein KJT01_07860 [Gemmatimonadetes bacterium]|nr:hypothetical protein [Gemmatimonadota bacterium]
MRRTPHRRGHTLVELLAALPLAALLLALVATSLVTTSQSARRSEADTRRARELRHALAVLAAELRPLPPHALTHVSDTLLAFEAPLLVGLACAQPTRATLVLVPTPAASAERPWRTLPATDDQVSAWGIAPDGRTLRPLAGTMAALQRTDPCALNRHPPHPAWRLDLRNPLPADMAPGLPVSVARPVRYRLYRTTDGWFLGRQALVRRAWETIQPVAGPLTAPGDGGMRVRAWDAKGTPLADGRGAHHLQVTVRAPAEATGGARPAPPLTLTGAITLRGPAQ